MDESGAIAALRALAQPTRLRIMTLLARTPGGMTAGEIATALGVRQNTLSSHIAILARSGLVEGRRTGRTIVYQSDTLRVRQVLEHLRATIGTAPRHSASRRS